MSTYLYVSSIRKNASRHFVFNIIVCQKIYRPIRLELTLLSFNSYKPKFADRINHFLQSMLEALQMKPMAIYTGKVRMYCS